MNEEICHEENSKFTSLSAYNIQYFCKPFILVRYLQFSNSVFGVYQFRSVSLYTKKEYSGKNIISFLSSIEFFTYFFIILVKKRMLRKNLIPKAEFVLVNTLNTKLSDCFGKCLINKCDSLMYVASTENCLILNVALMPSMFDKFLIASPESNLLIYSSKLDVNVLC